MGSKKLWALCGVIFLTELALGIVMTVKNGFIYGDAISRLANAFYVLFSRDPHLAAIGFIWNPLPSLMTLPILFFQPLIPQLSTAGIGVVVLSAIFAGLTVRVLINGFTRLSSESRVAGIICIILFAINPFQIWYGANGMSEVIFGCFIAMSIIRWTEWLKHGEMQPLLITSFVLALGFLTRYEGIPFAAALIGTTIIVMFSHRTAFPKIESGIILMALPITAAGLLWIWLNYTIMGDPLYFLRGSYSNLGQSTMLAHNEVFKDVIGSPTASFWYVVQRTAVFLIPYLALVISRFITRSIWRVDFLSLSLLVFSIPVFQWYMIMSGSSYGWLRFFYYPLLIVAAWLPYEFSLRENRSQKSLINTLMISSFIVTAIIVVPVMNSPVFAPEEHMAIHYEDSDIFMKREFSKKNASTLDAIFESEPDALVMTDSFNAYEVILYSRHPDRFINTTDRDFKIALEDPYEYNQNTYILVPVPEGLNLLNAVLSKYYGFYEERQEWVTLEKEMEGKWRLFKVIDHPHALNILGN